MENKKVSLWTQDFIFVALINLTIFLGFNITSTGMPLYVSALGANDFITGLATTLVTVAALVVRPFTGIIMDRFGHKGVLIVSLLFMIVIIAAYAVFPIVAIILALRVFHGITWGVTSTATSTIAADIIPRPRFAEGMGFFALAMSLAVAIGPALAIVILQDYSIVLLALIAGGSTVAALILTFFMHSKKAAQPKKKGKLTLSSFFEKQALLPAILIFFSNCAFGSVTTFIALHGQERGVDKIWMYFTVYAVVTIISRPLIGKVIDKIGTFLPGVLALLCVAATLVLISVSHDVVMFCIAGIFAGLGVGTAMGTFQTMAVATVNPARRGVATSTYLFGLDAGIGAGAFIAGAIANFAGYAGMYLVMAIFPMIAFFIMIVMGRKKVDRLTNQEGNSIPAEEPPEGKSNE